MAKASWCTTNPSSGSGSGTVNVGASVHTGRVSRPTTLTFKAPGAADKTVGVTQNAKAEFVILNDVSASKTGGTVTVTGITNSSRLTFALGAGDIELTLPESYSAGGTATVNAAAIAGDPGAANQFNFSIEFHVPANATTSPMARAVSVTTAGGQAASATISQAAGDPTLSVSPASVTMDADGLAVGVTVTSNTNWTVE